MENIHILEKNLKTINGQSILGEGNIEIAQEAIVDQNIDASTLTEEQLDYLRDKQIKYGSWRCESIPATSYTTPSVKLPFFRTKKNGQLTSQNETDFLFKKGVHYSIDTSYSIVTTNGAILTIALVNATNNEIIGYYYKTSRINVSGVSPEINGSRIFTVDEDTVGTFIITYLSTTPLTVTLSEIKVNITEISSFDVSLKNFKINGKSFDENNNIDLEGLSTLSHPKLNVEVLTERRHPVSNKPIYTKTIDFGFLPNTAIKNVAHTILNYDYIGINLEYSYIYIPDISGFSFSGALSICNNIIEDVGSYIDGPNISLVTGKNRANMKAYITVEYTKTIDTADSPVRLLGGQGTPGETGRPGRPGRDGTVEFELLTDIQKESLKGESQLRYMESGNLLKENINEDSLIINKPLVFNAFDNETYNIYGTGDNKIKIRPTKLVDRIPEDTDEYQVVEVDDNSNPFKDGSMVSRYKLGNDLNDVVGGGTINTLNNNTYTFKEVDGIKYLDNIITTAAAYMKTPVIEVGTSFTINFKFKLSTKGPYDTAILHFKNVEVAVYLGEIGYVLGYGWRPSGIVPVANTWYDVTVSVNNTESKIYINGVLMNNINKSAYTITATNHMGIFGRSYAPHVGQMTFVGGIRDIRIIKRAITDEEAMVLFKGKIEQNIVLYHGLGEVVTKVTIDYHTINLKAPTFKSAKDAREYGLKVGDIYIEVDTLKVLPPI